MTEIIKCQLIRTLVGILGHHLVTRVSYVISAFVTKGKYLRIYVQGSILDNALMIGYLRNTKVHYSVEHLGLFVGAYITRLEKCFLHFMSAS